MFRETGTRGATDCPTRYSWMFPQRPNRFGSAGSIPGVDIASCTPESGVKSAGTGTASFFWLFAKHGVQVIDQTQPKQAGAFRCGRADDLFLYVRSCELNLGQYDGFGASPVV
jgi:hypothetical protein